MKIKTIINIFRLIAFICFVGMLGMVTSFDLDIISTDQYISVVLILTVVLILCGYGLFYCKDYLRRKNFIVRHPNLVHIVKYMR